MSRHNIYKGEIEAFFLHYSEIMLKFAAEQNKERAYDYSPNDSTDS